MAVVTLNVNNKGNRGRQVPPTIKFIFFEVLAKIFHSDLLHKRKRRIEKLINKLSRTEHERDERQNSCNAFELQRNFNTYGGSGGEFRNNMNMNGFNSNTINMKSRKSLF